MTKIKIPKEWIGIAKDNWDGEIFHKNNSIKNREVREQSLVTPPRIFPKTDSLPIPHH